RPFDAENHATLMMNILDETRVAPGLKTQFPECLPALARLVEKMLKKNPMERVQTMEEVSLELESIWKEVRDAESSRLITAAEECLQLGDALRARELLRSVLQLDGANEHAKMLLERTHTELRSSQTNIQILDILDRGKTLLREGRIPEAVAAGEAALRI